MPRGTLQVAHGVIRFCSDDVFCPQKSPKNTYSLAVLAESEVTKIFQLALGNKSPSPVEHQTVVHFGIEPLMMISEGFKISDFGGGPDHNNGGAVQYARLSSVQTDYHQVNY